MGNGQTWESATSCCNGGHETGTIVIKTPQPLKNRHYTGREFDDVERLPSCHGTSVEELRAVGNDDGEPETSHPVAVNAFDKLTHLHGQIQQQLAAQETLIQQLLNDCGDGMPSSPDAVHGSL
mmetsp:Transcript_63523/g.184198  ORF Transcript_63523/g.184198 Transcript_63523/m.184198 type:complete len:123 (+) Transcript_63523:136-504(+)